MNALQILTASSFLFLSQPSLGVAPAGGVVVAGSPGVAAMRIDDIDLVDKAFQATLLDADGSKRPDATFVALVTRTEGYRLQADTYERVGDETRVYLNLERPGPNEQVAQVLSAHALLVQMTDDLGARVQVSMRRTTRGEVGMPVYELMATLPVK